MQMDKQIKESEKEKGNTRGREIHRKKKDIFQNYKVSEDEFDKMVDLATSAQKR